MYDGLFPPRGSNADRALTKSLREEERLRIVRPLSKGWGTSQHGILPIPGEEVEQHASGVTRRLEYAWSPPSQARLDSQVIGGLQEQTKELRIDIDAIRLQVRQLTELMQQILARPPA